MNDNLTPHAADSYDTGVRKTIPFYDTLHDQTIDLVKAYIPGVLNWLDTGCGTGTFALKASAEFPDCTFYLGDPSEKMLEICRSRITGERFQIAGAYPTHELPVKENSVDVITAIQSHHYLSRNDRLKTTRKCFSFLKPHGIYITFENFSPGTGEGIEIGLDRWVMFQHASGKTIEEAKTHRKRFGKEYFPIAIDDHFKVLQEAGFEICELFWVSYLQAGFYAIRPDNQ
jgi:tRNA (cmo5U34)-methyltransferase